MIRVPHVAGRHRLFFVQELLTLAVRCEVQSVLGDGSERGLSKSGWFISRMRPREILSPSGVRSSRITRLG
jgi:hypothetical protein